ncbi:PaaI family thioesterase [Planktotalea sp.]|uniref:PaaI family thioesterase n=1 Tax=Planktotalea sp. TaxID=2029877 RepID=UPI0025E3856C|nr:PaaI family thioesterase [Planktotalea sp.]
MELKMDAGALNTLMQTEFPQVATDYIVETVVPMEVTVRLPVADRHLRPGGTISGPTMFSLADVSIYLATMAMIGPVTLAVTTNCSIDFMRKPAAGVDLIATARLLKLGRLLAVGDVLIHSEGMKAPVARASLTYAIPPK